MKRRDVFQSAGYQPAGLWDAGSNPAVAFGAHFTTKLCGARAGAEKMRLALGIVGCTAKRRVAFCGGRFSSMRGGVGMRGFIELTTSMSNTGKSKPILVRVDSIEAVVHHEYKVNERNGQPKDVRYTAIYTSCDTEPFRIDESYEEVKRLISESRESSDSTE